VAALVASPGVAHAGPGRAVVYATAPSQSGPAVRITEVAIGDREVTLHWNLAPSDTVTPAERLVISELSFGRYNIYRTETPADLESFVLLRRYSVFNEPYDRDNPDIGEWYPFDQPGSDNLGYRYFVDPGDVYSYGAPQDDPESQYGSACCVHNGFDYYYAITYEDAFIDSSTGTPTPVFVLRQTLEEGILRDPGTGDPLAVQPGKEAREEDPLLADVGVVPNPFNPARAYEQARFPDGDRVQFINLPARCTIDIYTAAGDLIRTLDHDASGDAENWDLRNQNGQDISSGVYIFYVRAEGQEADGRFVIIR